jgi:hypothetical protein
VIWLDVAEPTIALDDLQKRILRLKALPQPFNLADGLCIDYLGQDAMPAVGLELPALGDFDSIDLLFDLRYDLPVRIIAQAKRSALLNIDPGQYQVSLNQGRYPQPSYDLFFSIGGTERFSDKPWIHTHQCVFLPEWPNTPANLNGAWSTVTHWWGGLMLDENGAWFPDAKRDGFLPYMAVPSEVSARFQIVVNLGNDVDEKRLIERSGFEVLSADAVVSTPLDYRAFIQNSFGEFSAAKPSDVKLKTSWISDRTLATGMPNACEGL